MCLRGEAGDVILARSSWTTARMDVREGEAMGILQALQWAQDWSSIVLFLRQMRN